MGLKDQFENEDKQASIAADCAQLMDEQVATKTGLSGLAIKTAYRAFKGIGPGYIPRVLQSLVPQALDALDPMWTEGMQSGDPVKHLSQNSSATADVLLGVTDQKLSQAKNKIVIATYKKVRKSVKGDVEEAVPGLAQILGNYANTSI
ncbi:hypothetical protein [Acaryochloris sp. IP29b_bin.148]|uniref:DUF6918 family protein n=1 Tax=Acaryochloris sp. IP29b_bin.148 TaxID=2969218 RepID=UPI00260E291B|nr:hypothetical protein [Acaryochloris sp. IP29b_bin.148]